MLFLLINAAILAMLSFCYCALSSELNNSEADVFLHTQISIHKRFTGLAPKSVAEICRQFFEGLGPYSENILHDLQESYKIIKTLASSPIPCEKEQKFTE